MISHGLYKGLMMSSSVLGGIEKKYNLGMLSKCGICNKELGNRSSQYECALSNASAHPE